MKSALACGPCERCVLTVSHLARAGDWRGFQKPKQACGPWLWTRGSDYKPSKSDMQMQCPQERHKEGGRSAHSTQGHWLWAGGARAACTGVLCSSASPGQAAWAKVFQGEPRKNPGNWGAVSSVHRRFTPLSSLSEGNQPPQSLPYNKRRCSLTQRHIPLPHL